MSFIKKYIDVKNNWVAFISSNEKYFYPGEYKFESQLRYIYLNDGENKKKAISMFGTNNQKFYKKMFIYFIWFFYFRKSFFINKNGRSEFNGSVFFINIFRSDTAKLFTFNKAKVMTFFLDEENFNKRIHYPKYFHEFPKPEILFVDTKELIVVEENIEHNNHNMWQPQVKNYILDRLFDIYGKHTLYYSNKKTNEFSNHKGFYAYFNNNLNKLDIPFKMTSQDFYKLPMIVQHGDLWAPNIMYSLTTDQFFIIDYEYVGNYIFFYDIFWYMFEQYFIANDNYYLSNYFSGLYDNKFELLFNNANLHFYSKYRLDYFTIFYFNFNFARSKEHFKYFDQFNQIVQNYS